MSTTSFKNFSWLLAAAISFSINLALPVAAIGLLAYGTYQTEKKMSEYGLKNLGKKLWYSAPLPPSKKITVFLG